MVSLAVQVHKDKVKRLQDLCRESADLEDTRVQGYLAKNLAILASAYIEISVKEVVSEFCRARSHPVIDEFVRSTVERENSLNCNKMQALLNKFDKGIWERLRSDLSEEEISAIDSLKALRDQIAHGHDNNTGYVVITRYFEAVVPFPEKLARALDAR